MKTKLWMTIAMSMVLMSCGNSQPSLGSDSSDFDSSFESNEISIDEPNSSFEIPDSSLDSSNSGLDSSDSISTPDVPLRDFGSKDGLQETNGWQEEKDVLSQVGTGFQKTYLLQDAKDNMCFKTQIKFDAYEDGKEFGRFGILLSDSKGDYQALEFKFDKSDNAIKVRAFNSLEPSANQIKRGAKFYFLMETTFEFSILRMNGFFYCFINSSLLGKITDTHFQGKALYAGVFTEFAKASFTNYEFISDSDSLNTILSSLTSEPTVKQIDADLSDWTNEEKTNAVSVFGYTAAQVDYSKQGFEVYAKYVKGDGLYIGGFASHYYNLLENSAWHENTNFEFFLNGDSQYYLTKNVNSDNLTEGSFKTVVEGEMYKSYFEAYIRECDIKWGVYDSSYIRLGLAFKNLGEKIVIKDRDGGAPTDYWWQDRHYPSNFTEQYYVYDDGIHTREK